VHAVTRRHGLALSLLVFVGLAAALAVARAAPAGAASTPSPPLYLVIDTSGSMSEGAPDSKLQVAMRAAYRIVQDIEDELPVTLVTYPGGSGRIEGCPSGLTRFGPGTADKSKLSAEIRSMTAVGETPIGPTLQHIRELFEETGQPQGTVVLLSDGEANCGTTDVCEVARSLNQSGLSLTVNTVGYDISDTGAEQLGCISAATGGKSLRVDADGNLSEALEIAAGTSLAVSVEMPTALETVTGTRNLGTSNSVTVTVRSVGTLPAPDVRVSLTLRDAAGAPGAAYVPRPVRYAGTLGKDVQSASLVYQPRPASGTAGPLEWQVTVTSSRGAPIIATGTVALVDSAKLATAGPLLTEATHVAIMGDSYSSGEGAGTYDDANNRASSVYACHRSANAYGRMLFSSSDNAPFGKASQRVSMLACSGAVTAHLNMYQHIYGTTPQLTQLNALTEGESPPDLVLLTLGGNDAGFSDFVSGCVLSGSLGNRDNPCKTTPGTSATADVLPYLTSSTLLTNLKAKYADIDAILNAPEVVAQRDGRIGQIVVLPYVSPLPPSERLRSGCFLGIADWELSMAQHFIDKVNGTLSAAVQAKQADGVPIHLVEPVRTAFQDGFTMCDNPTAVKVDEVFLRGLRDLSGQDEYRTKQELMHPNELGQRLVAQALIEWSRGVDPGWTSREKPAQSGASVESPIKVTYRRIITGTLPFDYLGPRFPQPADPLPLECRDVFGSVRCETITTMKLVMVRIESDPQFIGTVIAPDDPDFLQDLRLPEGLPAGRHTVIIDTYDADGQHQEYRVPLRTYAPGTRGSVLVGGLGVLLLGASALFLARDANRPQVLN